MIHRMLRALLPTLLAAALAAGEPISFGAWTPVRPGGKPLAVSYFNLVPAGDDGRIGLWFCAAMGRIDAQIAMRGPSLQQLPRPPALFDGTLVTGYTTPLLGRSSPIISRASATRLRDGTHVILASIGPEYGAGGKSTELYPVLFRSPDGQKGWTYLGAPTGEPKADLDRRRAAGALIRSDGGSIVEREDGTLRMYLHWDDAKGIRLACAEAATLDGPWTFLKDGSGAIRDVAPKLPNVTWIFPHVVPVGKRLLLTGGNAWPPKQILGAVSADGTAFTILGDAAGARPLLTTADFGPDTASIKCLRVAWNAKGGWLDAAANPRRANEDDYRLHSATASVDPAIFGLR